WSVGLKTAVAPQGTSITENQLVLLRRYHPQVECFFDSDAAGQKAALRFLPLALKAGLEARFFTLPGEAKLDPDLLFLERGIAAHDELRQGAQSAMAYACRSFLPQPGRSSAEERARAAQSVVEIVAASESATVRSSLFGEAARHLWLEPNILEREFQTLAAPRRRPPTAAPTPEAPAPSPAGSAPAPAQNPEYHLLLLCLHFEALGKPLSAALPHDWIDTGHPAGVLLNRFINEFAHGDWPGRDNLDHLLESPEERTLVAALLFETPVIDDPVKVAQEGLRQLRARALEPRLRQIELALANPRADSESDPISLLKERSELQRQLRHPVPLVAVI
ncbi:MAG: DNA primase, partial [Verrucomicrobia bacterium]|nr:DNA primase [Verrucomicrobiota bacterium]